MTRVYGPIRGAGVRVEEMDAERSIQEAALGVTGFTGVLERGPTNKLISTFGKRDFTRKCGGRIPESAVPDCCQDFWDHGEGAGELHLIRITDGSEVKAMLTLYARRMTAGLARVPVATLKAYSGGKHGGWGKILGKNVGVVIGDYTATTLTTGTTMLTDEWKGGYIKLDAVATKVYKILGNTSAGVVTIESDQNMLTDLGTPPPADLGWNLYRENDGKAISIELGNDEAEPLDRFWIKIYVDGAAVKVYDKLSMSPVDPRYYKNVITDDTDNWEVEITNIWTGGVSSDIRPGFCHFVNAITATLLTINPFWWAATGPLNPNPVVALGALTSTMKWEDTITCTVGVLPAFTAVSARFGSLGPAGAIGAAFTPNTPFLPPFTITNGTTVLAPGDVVTINYAPLQPGALKNGKVFPKLSVLTKVFPIIDNTVNTITVIGDMTGAAIAGDISQILAPQELMGGYDGIAGITDTHYFPALDPNTSYFNDLRGQNKGLVKLAAPGKTSTAVQKQGMAYAEAQSYEWRQEIPYTVVTEQNAMDHVNNTLGRNDFSVVTFPSYGYVVDPDAPDILKLIPTVGMVMGREAKVAGAYQGYHKAEAGTTVTLPRIKKLTTADRLDEERLNPAGIGVIKKVRADYVVWGDRTLSLDGSWKWKHQREQMSHYINTLRENFDWTIFDINDRISDQPVLTALYAYFWGEYQKRALDNDFPFKESCIIKMDGGVNTPISRAAGDKIAEMKLRLANVTERLVLRIGKAGVFEAVFSG